VTALLCCSSIPGTLFEHKVRKTVFLDLEIEGVEDRELQLTLDGTYDQYAFDSFFAGSVLDRSHECLELTLSCTFLLQDLLRVAAVNFNNDQNERSKIATKVIHKLVTDLSLTSLHKDYSFKISNSLDLSLTTSRKRCLKEHKVILLQAFSRLRDLIEAESITESAQRDLSAVGDFPEIEELLQREKILRGIRKQSSISKILGGDWFLKYDSLNLRSYCLKFSDS